MTFFTLPTNPADLLPSRAIVLLLGLACGAWTGMHFESANSAASLSEYRAEAAQASAAAQRAASTRYRAQVERGNALALSLVATQDQIANLNDQLRQRIPRVTTAYQPAPNQPVQPLPGCVFVRGWVRDYNRAFGLDLPGLDTAATASGTEPQPETAQALDGELLDSGVSQADLLAHAEDVAAYLSGVEAQRDGLNAYCTPHIYNSRPIELSDHHHAQHDPD